MKAAEGKNTGDVGEADGRADETEETWQNQRKTKPERPNQELKT